jgi:hypothetical protein
MAATGGDGAHPVPCTDRALLLVDTTQELACAGSESARAVEQADGADEALLWARSARELRSSSAVLDAQETS